jgi:hypothetical protein
MGCVASRGAALLGFLGRPAEEHGASSARSGSSGRGLFDRYGNLIGITTLIWVGETQTAQALNFALAADEFFAD